MADPQGHRGLRLLSLDGGGIRGLSELLILKEIMDRIQSQQNLVDPPLPCEYFDMIGGTSTGGLIALMLGRLRMSVDEAIKQYAMFAQRVFSDVKKSAGDGRFSASKFEEAVKEIVSERTGNPDERMMNARSDGAMCKTFVCAMPAHNMSFPHLFRTYQARKNQTFNCTIWEAARATSAAPTFFKRIVIGSPGLSQPFINGDMGCSNPIMQVLAEAELVFPGRSPSCIVSIGAGQAQTISVPPPSWFQQILPLDVITALRAIATDCERRAQEVAQRFRDRSNLYFRFNVEQGLQTVKLGQWERLEEVTSHTAQYIRVVHVDQMLDAVSKTIRVAVQIHGASRSSSNRQPAPRSYPSPTPASLAATTNSSALRVLCFDGGGFRGKASLLILDSLMRAVSAITGRHPARPCQYFDLIAGASTGGLIALMLGRLGYTTEEAIAKYTECASRIFGRVGSNIAWVVAGYPKVDDRPLEHLLKEISRAGGQDAELLEDPAPTSHCKCFVTITVPNAPGCAPILLRSYPSPATPIPFGHRWKIWEAARATSAAPVYFEPFELASGFRFSDAGAAGCNNPTMEAISELAQVPGFENRPIECLVSIGTGLSGLFQATPTTHPRPSGSFASITNLAWGVTEAPDRLEALIKYFTTVASDTQKAANYVYQKMDDKRCLEAYFRFDPPGGLGDFDLADITRGADIEVAAQDYVRLPEVAREIQRCAKILAKHPLTLPQP